MSKPKYRVLSFSLKQHLPTTKKSDLIANTLLKDIDKYRIQSFDTFGITLSVHPKSDARPVYDFDGRWVGFDEYYFESWGQHKKPVKVAITSTGSVRILHLDRWVRVASLMKELTPSIDWNDESVTKDFPRHEILQSRWRQQSTWWLANKKKFLLLDLPCELRDTIYRYAFGNYIEPYPTNKARRLGQFTGPILARKPNSALLLTCKKVYKEASNVLFLYTPFLVEHRGIMGPLMNKIAQRSRIRQLVLALSHFDFFRLFGGAYIDGKPQVPREDVYALRTLKLNRLELRLAPPSRTTQADWLDGACQRTVVDWIFERAWPFVRGHPVQITGFVKRTQKDAFEAACLVERKKVEMWHEQGGTFGGVEGGLDEYDMWLREEDGGVLLDEKAKQRPQVRVEEEDKTGAATVGLYVPECGCTVSCEEESWTAED